MPIFKPRPIPPPSTPRVPAQRELKKIEVQKKANSSGIFGEKKYLDKSSLRTKLGARPDFYTDPNIRMGRDQRQKFAEKINKLIPGKTTLNPGDIKIVDKKLAHEEYLAKGTSKEFEIKRQRAALRKISDIK